MNGWCSDINNIANIATIRLLTLDSIIFMISLSVW